MQIITEGAEAKAFLNNMRQTLTDLSTWEGWAVIDITARPPLDWIKQAKVTTLLRAFLPNGDGSIVWLDESIIVVFQPEKAFSFIEFVKKIEKSPSMVDLKLNMNLVWIAASPDLLLDLLAQRHRNKATDKVPEQPNYTYLKQLVPNIDDLLREWHKTKQVRDNREKPLILVVDDDPFTLKLVSQSLETDYQVATAKNGAEALTKHLQMMPDIIFLDIGLPDCDGISLLTYMQQYDGECRIVMFSADTFLNTRVKALAGGAKGYLPKPFNLFSFQKHIVDWIQQKALKSAPKKD